MKRTNMIAGLVLSMVLMLPLQSGAASMPQKLSLRQALQLLLKRNPNVARERLSVKSAKANVEIEKGAFGLNLKLDLQVDRSNLPAGMQLNPSLWNEKNADLFLQRVQLEGAVTLEKKFAIGTKLSIQARQGWNMQDRLDALAQNNNNLQTIQDSSNSIRLQVTQPLLRGAWLPTQLAPLRKAQEQAKEAQQIATAEALKQVAATVKAYWDLVFAQRDLKLRQEALKLAIQQRNNTKLMIKMGRLAAIELSQSEEAVAKRHQERLSAVERMNQAQTNIRDLLHTSKAVVYEPTDVLLSEVSLPSLEKAMKYMAAYHPNIKGLKHRIKGAKQDVIAAKNNLLPNLDLVAGVNLVGFGRDSQNQMGTALQRSMEMLVDPRSHNAYAGITFSIPLDRRQVDNQLTRTQIEVDKQKLMLDQMKRELRNQIALFHGQGKQILKRIAATKLTLAWAKKKWTAEQTKFQAGRSTLFQVLQFQQDVSLAQLSELKAQVDYQKALVSFYEKEGSLLKRFAIAKK